MIGFPKPIRKRPKNHTRRKITVSKRRMIAALDKDARQRVVIERDQDVCQKCDQMNGEWDEEIQQHTVIQWAHVQTREYHCLRWAEQNSLAMCKRCHVWLDNHKVLSLDWFAKKYPERWEMILRVLQSGAKANVRELYKQLLAGRGE